MAHHEHPVPNCQHTRRGQSHLPCPALPCPTLSCPFPFYFALSCHALSHTALPCLMLPYPTSPYSGGGQPPQVCLGFHTRCSYSKRGGPRTLGSSIDPSCLLCALPALCLGSVVPLSQCGCEPGQLICLHQVRACLCKDCCIPYKFGQPAALLAPFFFFFFFCLLVLPLHAC